MENIPLIEEQELIVEPDEQLNINTGVNILLCFLDGPKSVKAISKKLTLPLVSVKLFIERFRQHNLIKISKEEIKNNKKTIIFELVDKDLNFMHEVENDEEVSETILIKKAEKYYLNLVENIFENMKIEDTQSGLAKALFIKTNQEQINKFTKELEDLFAKYNELENKNEDKTYVFLSMLSQYQDN